MAFYNPGGSNTTNTNPTVNTGGSIIGGGLMYNANVNMVNTPVAKPEPPPPTGSQKPNYEPLLFTWGALDDELGAPVLKPATNNNSKTGSNSTGSGNNTIQSVINVFDDFDWTLTKREGRKHIPKVILTEYKQTQSSELRGYLYSLRGEINNIAVAGNIGVTQLKNFTNSLFGNSAAGKAVTLPDTAGLDSAKTDPTKKIPYNLTTAFAPYQGLYAVAKTGFTYALPYYTNANMVKVGNSWGSSNGDILKGLQKTASGVGQIIDALTEESVSGESGSAQLEDKAKKSPIGKGIGVLTGATNITRGLAQSIIGTQAGTLKKEELYAFNGASGREDVQVQFYLYNTIDHGDDVTQIQKNWEFCYLITYQNLPNRKGINFLDAPCLYGIDIPGYKNIPLAYLSGINIENVGNVRYINVKTGEVAGTASNDPYIKMIPEAYKVSLIFSSVLLNTRNTFLSNADPSNNINITTSES